MISRTGSRIRVGFSETETIWLKAAVTLALGERERAYRDIASMSGRTLSSVRHKARRLLSEHRAQVRAFLQAELSKSWQSGDAPAPRGFVCPGAETA